MSSRGTIAGMQRTNSYRPDGRIAQHILDATIETDRFTGRTVVFCKANEPMLVGQVAIRNGQQFFLVASKFSNRYYVVAVVKGQFACSSKDANVAAQMIAKVQAYRNQKAQAA